MIKIKKYLCKICGFVSDNLKIIMNLPTDIGNILNIILNLPREI